MNQPKKRMSFVAKPVGATPTNQLKQLSPLSLSPTTFSTSKHLNLPSQLSTIQIPTTSNIYPNEKMESERSAI